MRNRISAEETQLNTKNQRSVEETKFMLEGEEDIIIKCGLDEMVRRFFEDYIIVWHDPDVDSEENKQYIIQLQKFCEVRTFTEWEKAVLCIQETKAYCHVITSGINGEFLVKEINQSQKVSGIYVFCRNKDYHQIWANTNEKVLCVKTQIKDILDQIEENLLKWYQKESSLKMNLPAFAPIFNDCDKSGMNNLYRYLKIIPNFKNRLQAKNDLLALSKAIYSDKMNRSFMADFEENYHKYSKEAILQWYTKESFLFKVTNNCLRIASSDSIQYCRLVLKDLERAIKNQYKQKSGHFSGLLYRAASLSDKEWSNLKANLHREIEMHGFLSVSKDKNQALKFIQIDESKNLLITILVPKGPNNERQGFAEMEEFSRFPEEKEILFNVRSRFTILEAEDQYSEDLRYRHLVLFYGAQRFRKYLAEKNPVQEILIPKMENILCSICQEEMSQNMVFIPVTRGKAQSYFCKKCLPDFFKGNCVPLLCLPQGQPMKQIQLQGVLMKYPMNLEAMYGYQCCLCQTKKEKMFYRCVECHNKIKKVWCNDCLENFSECAHKEHDIILENNPFSFWCDKMSQKELDHFKFQNENLEGSKPFQQGEMYVNCHEYQKAIQYYKIYIQKDQDSKNYMTLALAYSSLAYVYEKQADHKRAFEFYSKALGIVKLIYGDNHPHVAGCYTSLGRVNESQAEYQKAIEYYSQALEISNSFYGGYSVAVAICFDQLGEIYGKKAEHKKALEYSFSALEIYKSVYGDNHPTVANSYCLMGFIYKNQAEHQKALEYHSKALEMYKTFYGDNHPNVAISYTHMGTIYESQAEYQNALEYHSKALEMYKAFYGDNHPNVAISYGHMGNIYERQAEYQNALEYHSKALEIRKSFYGDHHPYVAISYGHMGNIYERQAEYQKALEYHSKALEIRKSFYGDHHPDVASSYSSLGNIYQNQAEYHKAFECHSKAPGIDKSFYGDNHPNVAADEINLGNVYENQTEYQKALEYHSKALEIRKSFYGNQHPDVASSYSSLGNIYENRAEYQTALEYHSKALEMYKAFYGDNHLSIAVCFCNLARVYSHQAESQKALEPCPQDLRIEKLFHEANNLKTAIGDNGMGQVSQRQAEQKRALEYYSKSWEIMKLVFCENHPHTIAVKNKIQALLKVIE